MVKGLFSKLNRCLFNISGRKAQVTLFIIIGIVLLLVFGLVFYLSNVFAFDQDVSSDKLGKISSGISVQEYVESCLDQAVLESIYITLSQGGYYDFLSLNELDIYSDESEFLTLPYYFNEGELLNPSIEEIELEVASGIKQLFEECVNNFQVFTEIGYTIENSVPIVEVSFDEDWTNVDMNYPLVLSIEESSQEFESFSLTYSFSLPDKLGDVEGYLESQKADAVYFQAGLLSSSAYFGGYDFHYGYPENVERVVLVSNSYEEELWDDPLLLNFALLLDSEEQDSELDLDLLEETTANFIEEIENNFIYEWDVTNEGLSYYNFPVEGIFFELDPIVDGLSVEEETGIITLDGSLFPNDNYLTNVLLENEDGLSRIFPLIINVNIDYGADFPRFIPISAQKLFVGDELLYNVELVNPSDETIYTIDSSIAEIDGLTGEIRYIAREDDVGIHTVRVDAQNEFGENWMIFSLEVLER